MKRSSRLAAIGFACLFWAHASFASQATLVTPGAPLPMSSLASFINSALLSIGSCNSGTSAPANGTGSAAFAGECWINTSSNPWVFNYTPDGINWVEFGTLNTSTLEWTPYSNGFSATLGGSLSTAGPFTMSGAFAATLTFSGITNATFPAGTHTLAGLDVNQTFTGNDTFSTGTVNFTGTVEIGGNVMTFPGVAATLAYLAGSQTYTGNNTFNGTTALSGGGSMAGTFSGTPTISGNWTFSGDPNFTGLSTGTCSSGLGINASNATIKVSCPGAAGSIQLGTTTITGGTPAVGDCLSVATGPLAGQLNCAVLSLADQVLSGGVTLTPFSIGTVSSGTQTVDCGKNPVQFLLNGGAFVLAAPVNDGHCIAQVVNGPSAGAITLSGFSSSPSGVGDTFATTNTASGTATFTNGSANITYTIAAGNLGAPVYFTTSGTLPTNFSANTIYYVVSNSGTVITVAATPGGSAIVAGSAGTGTQTAHLPSVFAANIFRINGLANLIWKQQQ